MRTQSPKGGRPAKTTHSQRGRSPPPPPTGISGQLKVSMARDLKPLHPQARGMSSEPGRDPAPPDHRHLPPARETLLRSSQSSLPQPRLSGLDFEQAARLLVPGVSPGFLLESNNI
ncbi:unnamed protein product [Rangifer tarandus platyrhynchus]|uniref:Uncharacterized protein n=2 Tax=Rangifer tarandus platyrhynchus TaxID=3082113 RepID=A0ABN8ZHK5_RANTA|nr:unnamed protein product [Rangifer tarandus platyrhynchus]